MKARLILIFLGLQVSIALSAQDLLIFKSGQELQVNIKKVGTNTIEYVRFDNPNGPSYEAEKARVHKIIYQNGTEDYFQPLIISEIASIDEDFTDERDNTKYKFVVIGEQIWMAENLNYKTDKCLCHNAESENCDECGGFYTFDEAIAACPAGWHLPSDKEWMTLETEVGMFESDAANSGWRGNSPGQGPLLLKGGKSGLDLGMCGFLSTNGLPKDNPKYLNQMYLEGAFYWTSTEGSSSQQAYFRHLRARKSIYRDVCSKSARLTIRCIKD